MTALHESTIEPVARLPRFGALTPVITIAAIFLVATAAWWLLGDPKWSVTNASAPVVTCLLFWTLLGFVFTGFTFGGWPFDKLPQPVAGFAQVVTNVAIGVLVTILFTRAVGSWDPTFSRLAPGGVGYTATAFIVLVGFYAFSLAAASWGGYPFENVGGPVASVGQFFLASFITLIGVLVLVYPNFNAGMAANAPVALPTAAGWVYSTIVVTIVTAMQWQNAAWAKIGNRHFRAGTAAVVTLGGGYVLYRILEQLVPSLVPSTVSQAATFSASLETAEFGVCISLWALIFGLIVPPADKGLLASRALRTAIVVVLAVVTYLVFMRFAATTILHFPATGGGRYGGDPLLFMDWVILAVLWHAVSFGGHFSTRKSS